MSNDNANDVEQSTSNPADNSSVKGQTLAGPSVYEQCHAQDRKKNRYRKFSKAPIWIEALCAIALVVITGLYTHYARKQAKTANKTLGEIIKQYPEIKKSADAATKAANTAACALDENKRQFQITLAQNQQQFTDTLGQITAQTEAQVKAANAAKSSADTAEKARTHLINRF